MSKNNSIRPFENFSEFHKENPLAHQLPYSDFFENIVALSDGTLVAGAKLHGLSIESTDDQGINQITDNLRAFLNSLPDGWEFTFVADTNSNLQNTINSQTQLNESAPKQINWVSKNRLDYISQLCEQESIMKRDFYFLIYRRYKSLDTASSPLMKSFFQSPQKTLSLSREKHEKMSKELNQTFNSCLDQLESFGIEPKRLKKEEIITSIYQFLNPEREKGHSKTNINSDYRDQEFTKEEIVKEPKLSLASPREQLVFSDLIQSYDTLFCDNYYQKILTLKTLPEHTHAAMMSRLQELPFHNTIHVHIKVPEQSKELSSLQAKRRMAHSMSASVGGRASDLESEAQLSSTEDLLREIISTGQKVFYFQCTILIKSKSKETIDQNTRTILNKFHELNSAEGLKETIASFKVWKSILPFGTTKMVRPKRVKCSNLADFLPIYDSFTGRGVEPVCIFQNRSQGLIKYDPYHPGLINFNSLVTGSSGSGKSFLNNLILLQLMAQNPLLFVIDIGGSYKKLCEFFGGQYIEIKPPEKGEIQKVINPFHLPDGETEPTPQKIKFLLTFLESIFVDKPGDQLPKLKRSLLEEIINETYLNILTQEKRTPILSDLKKRLENSSEQSMKQFSKMLYPWTGSRPYGLLFDAENKFDINSSSVFWDLKFLSVYPDLQAAITLSITDFILSKVESKDPAIRKRKKRILMDECWDLLKNGGPATVSFMEYCVRTLRKTGSGITFITQGLSEIVDSPIGDAILSNTDSKFILKQAGDLEPTRKILKFNDQEMALVSSLKQKKGSYSEALISFNDKKSVLRIQPHPIEYWLATSDSTDNEYLEEYRSKHPEKSMSDCIYDLAIKYPKGFTMGNKKEGSE